MENIWCALSGSESHRLPLQWKGAQKTAVGRKSKRTEKRQIGGPGSQRGSLSRVARALSTCCHPLVPMAEYDAPRATLR